MEATTTRRRGGVDLSGALNLVGWLIKYLAPAFLFPAAIAVGYGEAVWPFLVAGAITFGFGVVCERLTDGRERIGAREGYLVVSLIWLLIAVFGAIPYVLAEPQLARPLDALFESMSGFSTTGSSVLTDIEAQTRSMAMWRQFTTWIGGVGIIVLFLAVLPRLRIGGRQALFRHEAAGPELGLADTIRDSARRFVVLYVAITALLLLALALLGWTGIDERMDLFRAVAHAFATIATAGFSTEGRSIEPFAPATQWVITFFMVVAGTNFALMFAAIVRRSARPFARDDEFRVYLAILALASAIVLLELVTEDIFGGEAAVRHAVFNVVSMMTTTGFASSDFNEWTALDLARAVRRDVDRRERRLDQRLDQARPARGDREDAAARARPDAAPAPGRAAAREPGDRRRARAARDHRVRLPLHRRAARRSGRDPDRLLAAGRAADRVRLARARRPRRSAASAPGSASPARWDRSSRSATSRPPC